MRSNIIMTVLATALVCSTGQAVCGTESFRTISGDSAISLTYILKHTSLAAKLVAGNSITWSLANLVCRQTNRGMVPDLMPVFACSPPASVGPITAKALFEALSDLGVYGEGAAGHIYEQAKSIQCKLNKNGVGGTATNPRCTLKAAWADECSYL